MGTVKSECPGLDRRTLVMSAISIAVGLGTPHPSLADTGPLTLDEARNVIGDRYRIFDIGDDDRQLTGAEIGQRVSSNTLYGVAYHGEPYVLAFKADGTGRLIVANEPIQTGRWWIDGDEVYGHWQRTGGGEPHAHYYYATGETDVYKQRRRPGYDDGLDKWSMFLVARGIPHNLAK